MLVDIPCIVLSYLLMSLSHLALVSLILYVLILWICIFRFRGLERSGAIHWGPRVSERAGWSVLVPSCRTLPFGSQDPSLLREHFVYILVYDLVDLVVKTKHL